MLRISYSFPPTISAMIMVPAALFVPQQHTD